MAKQEKKMSFEEALAGLERSADILRKDGTTLEEAMQNFEKGVEFYRYCNEMLNDAKQKIEFYDKKEA